MVIPIRSDYDYRWECKDDVVELTAALAIRMKASNERIRREGIDVESISLTLLKMYADWWKVRQGDLELQALLAVAAASEWIWQGDEHRLFDLIDMLQEVVDSHFDSFDERKWNTDYSNYPLQEVPGALHLFTSRGLRFAVSRALSAVVQRVLIEPDLVAVHFTQGDYGDGPFDGAVCVDFTLNNDRGAMYIRDNTGRERHFYQGSCVPQTDRDFEEALVSQLWKQERPARGIESSMNETQQQPTVNYDIWKRPSLNMPPRYPSDMRDLLPQLMTQGKTQAAVGSNIDGVGMSQRSNMDGVGMSQRSNVDGVGMSQRSNMDGVGMSQRSNMDGVGMSQRSNMAGVGISQRSNMDGLGISRRSNMDGVGMSQRSNMDGVGMSQRSNMDGVGMSQRSQVGLFPASRKDHPFDRHLVYDVGNNIDPVSETHRQQMMRSDACPAVDSQYGMYHNLNSTLESSSLQPVLGGCDATSSRPQPPPAPRHRPLPDPRLVSRQEAAQPQQERLLKRRSGGSSGPGPPAAPAVDQFTGIEDWSAPRSKKVDKE